MEAVPENYHGIVRVSIAQISATVLGSIFWLLLADIVHPLAYGQLSWFVGVATILSAIFTLGLGKTIVTYFPKEKDQGLLGESVFLVFVIGLVSGAVTALVLGLPMGLLVLGLSLFSMAFHLELAKRRYRNYMWMWVGVRVLSLVLPLLAYWLSGLTAGVLVGLAVSYLVFGFYVLRYIRPSIRRVRKKLGFIYGAWGADVGSAAVNSLDKILIGSFFGMELLGYYQFANRIFVLLGVLPQILFFYLLPERSAGSSTKKVERAGMIAALALAGLVFFLAPIAIPAAFPSFGDGVIAVQIMGLAIIPATMAGIRCSKLYCEENTKAVLGSNLLAIGVGVTGIATLGKHFGLIGLAVSLLLLQVAMLFGLFLLPKLLNWGTAGKLAGGFVAMTLVSAALLGSMEARGPVIEIQDGRVIGKGFAMDTTITITVENENIKKDGGSSTEMAVSAVRAAFDEIYRLEKLMSTTDPASEIYALNNSGTEWVSVSSDVIYVLQKAKYYSELSNGAFDVTVEPLVNLWMDKVKESGKEPDPAQLQSAMALVGWENLEIDENNSRVRFLKDGMQVTLGGIAKGYAEDKVVELLKQAGVKQALVEMGGQIAGFGPKTWRAGIQHPRIEGDRLGVLSLDNSSVATSGDYRRFYLLNGKRIHHIIDPRTGMSAEDCISVTVVAENGVDADALSTAVFVAGPVQGKALLDNLGLRGLIVTAEGELVQTIACDFENLVTHVTTWEARPSADEVGIAALSVSVGIFCIAVMMILRSFVPATGRRQKIKN
jgi:thiamine biosynthesis lipoprotein